MKDQEIVSQIRARVDQCRRLAASTTEERTARILEGMADEGDRDIQRILDEGRTV